jgi:hypothetical protein
MNYLSIPILFFAASASAQQPDELDPGNVRGDEGTVDLWEQPEVYVPVLVIVVLLVAFAWLKKKRMGIDK